jgi:thiamine pyrophosphate-dependent acetolactate synthase large subunit-like protein
MGFGLARALPHRKVVVLESDGGILFSLGALCTLGNFRQPNLKVIVMDNECYESIGAMPTATAGRANLEAIAKGAGIENAVTTRTLDEFKEATNHALAGDGLYFVVAKIEKGTKEVPTLYLDGLERKYQFVRYIEETEGIHIISPGLQHVGRYWEKK